MLVGNQPPSMGRAEGGWHVHWTPATRPMLVRLWRTQNLRSKRWSLPLAGRRAGPLQCCPPLISPTWVSQSDHLPPWASVSSSVISKGLNKMLANVPSGSPSTMDSGGHPSVLINLLQNEALSPGGKKCFIGRVMPKFDLLLESQVFGRKRSLFRHLLSDRKLPVSTLDWIIIFFARRCLSKYQTDNFLPRALVGGGTSPWCL